MSSIACVIFERRSRFLEAMGHQLPTFSVIIPTYNRPLALHRCLNALLEQDYPNSQLEIIVVNDGGAPLPEVIGEKLRKLDRFIFLDQLHQGPASARNAGVRAAKGKFLAFTDDDCAPQPGWLSAMGDVLEGYNRCAVGGWTINGLIDNPFSTASQLLIEYLYYFYHIRSENTAQLPFFSSNNLALRREIFLEMGGFNPQLVTAEDRDLCARLHAASIRLIYAPDACVIHYHDLNLKRYLSQHFHYGQGNYYYHQLNARRVNARYRLERSGFYTEMLRYPFTKTTGRQAFLLSGLLALSQVG